MADALLGLGAGLSLCRIGRYPKRKNEMNGQAAVDSRSRHSGNDRVGIE